jgi:hypothetical protein
MPRTPPRTDTPSKLLLDNGSFLDASNIGTTGLGVYGAAGTQVASIGAGGANSFSFGSSQQFTINSTGLPTKSNNVALVGQGFPLIVAASVQNQTNLAPTTVSFTPPATAGTYRVSSWLDLSTATTVTFKNILGYTDAAGTAQTDKVIWEQQNSATMLVDPTANTTGRFVQLPYLFSVDNSGTAITLGDNTGTYTTCVYRYTVILEQLV